MFGHPGHVNQARQLPGGETGPRPVQQLRLSSSQTFEVCDNVVITTGPDVRTSRRRLSARDDQPDQGESRVFQAPGQLESDGCPMLCPNTASGRSASGSRAAQMSLASRPMSSIPGSLPRSIRPGY